MGHGLYLFLKFILIEVKIRGRSNLAENTCFHRKGWYGWILWKRETTSYPENQTRNAPLNYHLYFGIYLV